MDWLHHERELWRSGYGRIAGIDEAGRGPLAGPVVAAAVIFEPEAAIIRGINDSKKLTAARREALYDQIITAALAVGIGLALGAGQFYLLRRCYPRPVLWLLASALGYLAFMALVANPSQSLEELIIRVTVGGVFAAVLPGLLLTWWNRQATALPATITPGAPPAGD